MHMVMKHSKIIVSVFLGELSLTMELSSNLRTKTFVPTCSSMRTTRPERNKRPLENRLITCFR